MNLKEVHPTKAQMAALMNYPKDQALVMVNILKYQKETSTSEKGRAVYQRYMKNTLPLLQKAGAKLLWMGEVNQTVIGEEQGQPNTILLVEYPSVQHFLEMAQSDAYQQIAHDRSIALEYGGLLACTSTM